MPFSAFLRPSKKLADAIFFAEMQALPTRPSGSPGGRACKETLLRKASETAAHVAGFGRQSEGCDLRHHPLFITPVGFLFQDVP